MFNVHHDMAVIVIIHVLQRVYEKKIIDVLSHGAAGALWILCSLYQSLYEGFFTNVLN